jgi:opacity protein-like surface antigen
LHGGGAAWLYVESSSGCGAPAVITNATSKTGWTVGGGLEAMLWSNWVARAEYRYADFGTITSTNTRTGVNGPEIVTYGVAVRTHTALFGSPTSSIGDRSSPNIDQVLIAGRPMPMQRSRSARIV